MTSVSQIAGVQAGTTRERQWFGEVCRLGDSDHEQNKKARSAADRAIAIMSKTKKPDQLDANGAS